MDRRVGFGTIAYADVWIYPNTSRDAQGVVYVDEAAFRRFNMMTGQRVGDSSELKSVHPIKWL